MQEKAVQIIIMQHLEQQQMQTILQVVAQEVQINNIEVVH